MRPRLVSVRCANHPVDHPLSTAAFAKAAADELDARALPVREFTTPDPTCSGL